MAYNELAVYIWNMLFILSLLILIYYNNYKFLTYLKMVIFTWNILWSLLALNRYIFDMPNINIKNV